ncbi:MAG: Yip1 family protein [Bacteroidota bacterium]
MHDILDELEEKTIPVSDLDIFTKIWFSPRRIFQYIHANKYDEFVTPLLIIAGIFKAFDRAIYQNMGDQYSLMIIVILCFVIGGTLGALSIYFYALLLSWTGKWIKGKADSTEILRIIAYALIPSLVSLILLAPQILTFGIELFQSSETIVISSEIFNLFLFGLTIIQLIMILFSIVFMAVGLSVAQKFSVGKAILNMILSILVVIVPITLLVLFYLI